MDSTRTTAPKSTHRAQTDRTPRSDTWERLLVTAARLFWTAGYTSTSTREIAEAVGVRKASLYHHISGKEDLLFAISMNSLDRIIHEARVAIDAVVDPSDRVRALIHAHVASMIADQNKHSVMLTELRALSPARRERIVARRDDYERIVSSVLEDARSAGVVRDDIPVKYLSLSLLNMLNWSIFWFRPDGDLGPDRLAEYWTTLFLSGAGRRPETP